MSILDLFYKRAQVTKNFWEDPIYIRLAEMAQRSDSLDARHICEDYVRENYGDEFGGYLHWLIGFSSFNALDPPSTRSLVNYAHQVLHGPLPHQLEVVLADAIDTTDEGLANAVFYAIHVLRDKFDLADEKIIEAAFNMSKLSMYNSAYVDSYMTKFHPDLIVSQTELGEVRSTVTNEELRERDNEVR